MQFDKLKADSPACDCVDKANENIGDRFIRKLTSNRFDEKTILSYWEEEKRPLQLRCRDICDYKGVSVRMFVSPEELLDHGKKTKSFSPYRGRFSHYCMFRFKSGAGVLFHREGERDKQHYNWFKSDAFTLEMLDMIEIKEYIDASP